MKTDRAKKTKITCHSCAASYSIDLSKLPEKTSHFKCLKCGHRVPLLVRLVKAKRTPSTIKGRSEQNRTTGNGKSKDEGMALFDSELNGGWQTATPLEQAGDDSHWLAIYGDIMSLLLIFFILMFAISSIDRRKFETVMSAVSEALGGHVTYATELKKDAPAVLPPVLPPPPPPEHNSALDNIKKAITEEKSALSGLQTQLTTFIENNQLQDKFMVLDEQNGLVIMARDMSMFDLGSADISQAIRPYLRAIGTILKQIDNDVVVEGHTDDLPINTSEFSSNWELSVMRATNVVHFLAEECDLDSSRLGAAGYAYFRPRYSMEPAERAKNRRIEIVVKKKYSSGTVEQILQLQ